MKKVSSKKGFTLMEMLIVVAIIAILVAIAIPTFSGQLTKARQAADNANVRAAYSEAMTKYLTDAASLSVDPTASTTAMQADYDGSTNIAGLSSVSWKKGQTVTITVDLDTGKASLSAG